MEFLIFDLLPIFFSLGTDDSLLLELVLNTEYLLCGCLMLLKVNVSIVGLLQ